MLTTVRLATAVAAVLVALIGALYALDTIDGATAQATITKTVLVVAICTAAAIVVQALSRRGQKT